MYKMTLTVVVGLALGFSTGARAFTEAEMAKTVALLMVYDKHCQPISDEAINMIEIVGNAVPKNVIATEMLKIDAVREKISTAVFCRTAATGIREELRQ